MASCSRRANKGLIAALAFMCGTLCVLASASAEMVWHRGALGDPGSLDPHKATTKIESHVLGELFEGLVSRDAFGALIPGVAKRWDISPDGLVYRFELREDAKWSNGDRVRPQDFIFAFRRLMAPETGAPYANILYTLKNAEKVNRGLVSAQSLGVRALDDFRLEITLEHPAPYFIDQLTHMTAKPLHKASMEAQGGSLSASPFAHPELLVTNGPFRLKDYTPNDSIVLVKNEFHYDAAKIALDREIFHPIEDRAAALRRFMAGEIHSYDDVPAEQIAFVRARLPDSFRVTPSLAGYYYAFDTRHPPFSDKRVRQALSLVIDREFLAESIWGGTMDPAYSFVPRGIAAYGTPETLALKDTNLFEREDEARRLLREAGYGEGWKRLEVEIRFNNSENHRATAVAIADMWSDLGVTTRLLATDATSHFAFLREKAPFDVVRFGWFADFPDAENFLFLAESDNKALNVANFSNAAYDSLLEASRRERSATTRSTLLHEAEALLVEEQPYLILMHYRSSHLLSPKLHGFEPNVLDVHYGRYVSVEP
jgi:oligopeptide transport system substrate-binding protein